MSNLIPTEARIDISGGEALIGGIPPVPDPQIECDILVNDMREMSRMAHAAAKLPLKFLRMANRIITKVSNEALALTDAALADLEDLVNLPLAYITDPSHSLAASAAAIDALINCAYVIGNPELLEALKDTKDQIAAGRHLWRDINHAFRKYVGNTIKKGAHALIDDMLKDNAIGKLNSIKRNYKDLLKTSGVKDLLTKMDLMVNCAAGACAKISPLIDKSNELYTKLGLDDNGDPLDIFTNSSEITDSKKYIVSRTSDKINSLRAQIDAFEFI